MTKVQVLARCIRFQVVHIGVAHAHLAQLWPPLKLPQTVNIARRTSSGSSALANNDVQPSSPSLRVALVSRELRVSKVYSIVAHVYANGGAPPLPMKWLSGKLLTPTD